jgi:hypothetical protein
VGYSIVHVDDMEPGGPGGAVRDGEEMAVHAGTFLLAAKP